MPLYSTVPTYTTGTGTKVRYHTIPRYLFYLVCQKEARCTLYRYLGTLFRVLRLVRIHSSVNTVPVGRYRTLVRYGKVGTLVRYGTVGTDTVVGQNKENMRLLTLKPLECVVDEDPVLVGLARLTGLSCS